MVYNLLLQSTLDLPCDLLDSTETQTWICQYGALEVGIPQQADLDFLALIVNSVLDRRANSILIDVILALGLLCKGRQALSGQILIGQCGD